MILSFLFLLLLLWKMLFKYTEINRVYLCVCVSHSVESDSVWPYGLSPPGSSVHRILQAWILEWVAISFSNGSSQPRDRTCVSCIGRWILIHRATREVFLWSFDKSQKSPLIVTRHNWLNRWSLVIELKSYSTSHPSSLLRGQGGGGNWKFQPSNVAAWFPWQPAPILKLSRGLQKHPH